MKIKKPTYRCPAGRRVRGFTVLEITIGMVISSLVMVTVASVQYLSARTTKDVYGETRTRSSRMRSLDQIRYRLCNAKVGSLVLSEQDDTTPGFHRVEFIDPNLGGPTSVFYFEPETRTLFYKANKTSWDAEALVAGPINISFEPLKGGALVLLRVKSSSDMAYGDVDLQDGETLIYVRNT